MLLSLAKMRVIILIGYFSGGDWNNNYEPNCTDQKIKNNLSWSRDRVLWRLCTWYITCPVHMIWQIFEANGGHVHHERSQECTSPCMANWEIIKRVIETNSLGCTQFNTGHLVMVSCCLWRVGRLLGLSLWCHASSGGDGVQFVTFFGEKFKWRGHESRSYYFLWRPRSENISNVCWYFGGLLGVCIQRRISRGSWIGLDNTVDAVRCVKFSDAYD